MIPKDRTEYRVAMLEKSLQTIIEQHHSLVVSLTRWLDSPGEPGRAFLKAVMAEQMRKLRNNPYFPDEGPETPSMFGPGKPK